MTDYPRTQALLRRMWRLDAASLDLPWELLERMHTSQMKAPLANLLNLALDDPEEIDVSNPVAVADAAGRVFDRHYPDLEGGNVYFDNFPYVNNHLASSNHRALALSAAKRELGPAAIRLVQDVEDDWYGYEPVVILYYLAVNPEGRTTWLRLLEAGLCAHDVVEEMLLDLA